MELKWLEDFIALSEHGSFSKAATSRYVTQPAYSRRIRALENWVGVSLIDREFYPTTLTEAGEKFLTFAHESVAGIYEIRESIHNDIDDSDNITIKTQHSLTVSFLPSWLQTLEALINDKLLKVHADNLHDAADSFLGGTGDFLLSYSSDAIKDKLQRSDIESLQVGADYLVPVTGSNDKGEPIYSTDSNAPLRLLSYPQESFFGRLVHQHCMKNCRPEVTFQYVYENALSEALKVTVLKGYGVTWLPKTLVTDELASGKLHILNDPLTSVKMSIQLYRFEHHQSDNARVFWNYLTELYSK